MKKRIYVVGPAKMYSKWIQNHELVDNLEDADIVMFTGGEDVDPSLYGCKKHSTTFSNLKRDLEEKAIFEKVKPNQLCIGVCRGAQFLGVMNGGLLIQNVGNHAHFGTHTIVGTLYSDEWEITSTHHQMQYPFNLDEYQYDILYFSPNRSSYYEGDGISEPSIEPEIVLYKVEGKPKCLAIQGHPEIMRPEAPILTMLNQLVDKYVAQ